MWHTYGLLTLVLDVGAPPMSQNIAVVHTLLDMMGTKEPRAFFMHLYLFNTPELRDHTV